MKRTILTLAIALISVAGFAQKKQKPVAKKAAVKTDSVKTDTIKASDHMLHISLSKQDADYLLKGLLASQQAATESEAISAAAGTKAINMATFFIQMICQKWPELAPKK